MTARRIECAGNCGRWFYYDPSQKPGKKRGGGRPPEWCPRCYGEHRNERRRLLSAWMKANGLTNAGKRIADSEAA
jgi:hypothetical protein